MAIIKQTQSPSQTPSKIVCFSFAAYSKTIINHLKSINVPVQTGLSEPEFLSIERLFNFTFPPDLHSILQQGLPVSPGFPNWRSSSYQQLHILLNLPVLGILKEVSLKRLWCDSWGAEPDDRSGAMALAKGFLSRAPLLVPIYRNCYVPATPNMVGNPVFYVNGGDIRVLSFDVCRFFQEIELFQMGIFRPAGSRQRLPEINAPAWAAKEARKIEFWTEMAERGKRTVARDHTGIWWSGELGVCLEEMFRKLRDGGWKEEEVKEMMMIVAAVDGGFGDKNKKNRADGVVLDKEAVVRHMKLLSHVLLGAGWSKEDVAYSLGLQADE